MVENAKGRKSSPRIYASQATTPPFRSEERLSGTIELFWVTRTIKWHKVKLVVRFLSSRGTSTGGPTSQHGDQEKRGGAAWPQSHYQYCPAPLRHIILAGHHQRPLTHNGSHGEWPFSLLVHCATKVRLGKKNDLFRAPSPELQPSTYTLGTVHSFYGSNMLTIAISFEGLRTLCHSTSYPRVPESWPVSHVPYMVTLWS